MNRIKQEEKNIKILSNVIIGYYFSKSAKDLNISVRFCDGRLIVESTGNVDLNDKDLQELAFLKQPYRLPEFENYYEDLLSIGGSSNKISRMDALASIIDKGDWSYADGLLRIVMERAV